MNNIKAALLSIAVFGMSVTHADILATGPMSSGASQRSVVCYIFNAGVGPVDITSRAIYIYNSTTSTTPLTPLDEDTCTATLSPGASCAIRKSIVNTRAHACRIIVNPTGADVRGRFEIRDSNDSVLQGADLR